MASRSCVRNNDHKSKSSWNSNKSRSFNHRQNVRRSGRKPNNGSKCSIEFGLKNIGADVALQILIESVKQDWLSDEFKLSPEDMEKIIKIFSEDGKINFGGKLDMLSPRKFIEEALKIVILHSDSDSKDDNQIQIFINVFTSFANEVIVDVVKRKKYQPLDAALKEQQLRDNPTKIPMGLLVKTTDDEIIPSKWLRGALIMGVRHFLVHPLTTMFAYWIGLTTTNDIGEMMTDELSRQKSRTSKKKNFFSACYVSQQGWRLTGMKAIWATAHGMQDAVTSGNLSMEAFRSIMFGTGLNTGYGEGPLEACKSMGSTFATGKYPSGHSFYGITADEFQNNYMSMVQCIGNTEVDGEKCYNGHTDIVKWISATFLKIRENGIKFLSNDDIKRQTKCLHMAMYFPEAIKHLIYHFANWEFLIETEVGGAHNIGITRQGKFSVEINRIIKGKEKTIKCPTIPNEMWSILRLIPTIIVPVINSFSDEVQEQIIENMYEALNVSDIMNQNDESNSNKIPQTMRLLMTIVFESIGVFPAGTFHDIFKKMLRSMNDPSTTPIARIDRDSLIEQLCSHLAANGDSVTKQAINAYQNGVENMDKINTRLTAIVKDEEEKLTLNKEWTKFSGLCLPIVKEIKAMDTKQRKDSEYKITRNLISATGFTGEPKRYKLAGRWVTEPGSDFTILSMAQRKEFAGNVINMVIASTNLGELQKNIYHDFSRHISIAQTNMKKNLVRDLEIIQNRYLKGKEIIDRVENDVTGQVLKDHLYNLSLKQSIPAFINVIASIVHAKCKMQVVADGWGKKKIVEKIGTSVFSRTMSDLMISDVPYVTYLEAKVAYLKMNSDQTRGKNDHVIIKLQNMLEFLETDGAEYLQEPGEEDLDICNTLEAIIQKFARDEESKNEQYKFLQEQADMKTREELKQKEREKIKQMELENAKEKELNRIFSQDTSLDFNSKVVPFVDTLEWGKMADVASDYSVFENIMSMENYRNDAFTKLLVEITSGNASSIEIFEDALAAGLSLSQTVSYISACYNACLAGESEYTEIMTVIGNGLKNCDPKIVIGCLGAILADKNDHYMNGGDERAQLERFIKLIPICGPSAGAGVGAGAGAKKPVAPPAPKKKKKQSRKQRNKRGKRKSTK
jgi:hypothetical protein